MRPRRHRAEVRQPRDPVPSVSKLRSRRSRVPATSGPPDRTDAEVIAGSVGDPERFAVIFDRHANEIQRYASRRLGLQAAADVVSEVFLAAFRNRGNAYASGPGPGASTIRHCNRSIAAWPE